jgi:hypothetical protein
MIFGPFYNQSAQDVDGIELACGYAPTIAKTDDISPVDCPIITSGCLLVGYSGRNPLNAPNWVGGDLFLKP